MVSGSEQIAGVSGSAKAGAELNRQVNFEEEGKPDVYLAPEAGIWWKLPSPPWGNAKLMLDIRSQNYLNTGNDLTLEGGLTLSQKTKTGKFNQDLSSGYDKYSGSDDLDKPSRYFFMEGGVDFTPPSKWPLKFSWNLKYLDELGSGRWDIRNSLGAKLQLKTWKSLSSTVGLTFNWNKSDIPEFDYFGPNLTFTGICMINEDYYFLGFLSLSSRSYHSASGSGSVPSGNPRKLKTQAGNGIPTAGYSLVSLSLYREITENLDWATEFLLFFNNYDTESYYNAQLSSGFEADF